MAIGWLARRPDERIPARVGQPRGRTSTERAVVLPEGWLADRHDRTVPFAAETDHSGG